jgi:hypothetical protein
MLLDPTAAMVTDVSSAENCATVVQIQSTCHCER